MNNNLLKLALFFGATAVIFGAIGAHYLPDRIMTKSLSAYKTAVNYQFIHTLLMLVIGLSSNRFSQKYLKWFGVTISLGIILFSWSILILATREVTGLEVFLKFVGPITPIGGVLLILSWTILFFGLEKNK